MGAYRIFSFEGLWLSKNNFSEQNYFLIVNLPTSLAVPANHPRLSITKLILWPVPKTYKLMPAVKKIFLMRRSGRKSSLL
jgi:hypothetical protein